MNGYVQRNIMNTPTRCKFRSRIATFPSLLGVVVLLESDVKLLENRCQRLHLGAAPHAQQSRESKGVSDTPFNTAP